jgi:hypothetical protein
MVRSVATEIPEKELFIPRDDHMVEAAQVGAADDLR